MDVGSVKPFQFGHARRCCYEQLELRRLLAADVLAADLDLAEASIAGRVHLTATETCPEADHAVGIADVTLHLLNEQGRTVQSTNTSDSGSYSFTGLIPGIYAVLQDQPAGLRDAGLHIGSGGGQFLSPNLVGEIEITAGANLTGYDFCESAATSSQNDGPPKLDRQGGSVVITSTNNVFLLNPSVPTPTIASQFGAPAIEGMTTSGTSLPRRAINEGYLIDPALSDDFGDIATRRRRETARPSLTAEGLGSAFDRVREAIVDELFDRVSWNAETLRNAVVEPLSWLVPDRNDTSSEQSEAVETAEASQPAIKVAEATQQSLEETTEVR